MTSQRERISAQVDTALQSSKNDREVAVQEGLQRVLHKSLFVYAGVMCTPTACLRFEYSFAAIQKLMSDCMTTIPLRRKWSARRPIWTICESCLRPLMCQQKEWSPAKVYNTLSSMRQLQPVRRRMTKQNPGLSRSMVNFQLDLPAQPHSQQVDLCQTRVVIIIQRKSTGTSWMLGRQQPTAFFKWFFRACLACCLSGCILQLFGNWCSRCSNTIWLAWLWQVRWNWHWGGELVNHRICINS